MPASKKTTPLKKKTIKKSATASKTATKTVKKIRKPRKTSKTIKHHGKNSKKRLPIMGILLGLSLIGLGFLLFDNIKYKAETASLKQLVLKLTPTQPPLLKDMMNEKAFQRPKDIPESSTSAKITIPIIMYHYVEVVQDQKDITRKGLSVTPDQFETQLIAIKNAGYDSYFARDIPDIISQNVAHSDKIVVLTFDDGYEDFYKNVFPLLKRYNMRATAYIISDFVGKKDFMNPKQIQELIDSGLVEIGAHSVSHIPLKTASDDAARKEVFDSKQKLETQFNIKIKSFAYPGGSFSLKTADFVKEAGYTNAVSTISGSDQSLDNLYYLNRVRPGIFTPVQ